jgi:hypothetical protein
MKREPRQDQEPPARLAGALLGAAIPVITFVGIFVAIYTTFHMRAAGGGNALVVLWPNLGWLSVAFAMLGAILGFDRLLALISPLWSAITWLWNKDRELSHREDEFVFEHYFSIVFGVVVVALVYLAAIR